MANNFGLLLNWLRSALQLQGLEVPSSLDTSQVLPVLDIASGGWAVAEYQYLVLARAASTATAREQLIAPDPAFSYVLIALEVSHSAGAAGTNITAEIYNVITNTGLVLAQKIVPINTTFGHFEIFDTVRPIWIPPGYGFATRWPTTGVGETWGGELLYAKIPAGFAPPT